MSFNKKLDEHATARDAALTAMARQQAPLLTHVAVIASGGADKTVSVWTWDLSQKFTFTHAESVQAVAEFLLQHLSLLFVPVGVGVMTHLDVLGKYGARIAIVIVLSTWISLAVTALVLRALMRDEKPEADNG